MYPTESFPHLYTEHVNLYIEIDLALVNHNTGMAGAINYVNVIVTAASTIYERDIDTHRE